ncbi:snurportin-1 [Leptinotarsa decemlineata]|uniref:snurportin-1 n=1 Tax=Leptinotarsa decemlineata TaxID=7539 RepID=UPI000C2553B3|nr:snurportin-1 [Leptinotarsa decemlineata]
MEVPDFDLSTNFGTCSSYSSFYKNNGFLKLSQKQRRQAFLENQKERRHQLTDKNREQCEEFIKLLKTSIEDDLMECDSSGYSTRVKMKKFQLMLSEWLTEIPEDLDENWIVKFAPEGFRVLLVAHSRNTLCYNKNGRVVLKLRSNFPGGRNTEGKGLTVLDCIYNKTLKTIFVLDCLFWNAMSLLEAEVNFRFFWLKSKFEDNPELVLCSRYKFVLLESIPAQRPLIQDRMFSPFLVGDQRLYIDGVVFYHKESHYVFGSTPLVAWLASYMLPEMLNIDVPCEDMARKPKGYICQQSYLIELKSKRKKKTGMDILDAEMELQ